MLKNNKTNLFAELAKPIFKKIVDKHMSLVFGKGNENNSVTYSPLIVKLVL